MRTNVLSCVSPILVAILLVVFVSPVPALAQRVDLAGGYSFARLINTDGADVNEPTGWFGSIGVGISPMVAIVGELNGAYKTDAETIQSIRVEASHKAHSYLAGLRVMSPRGTVRVFGQVLFGGETDHISASASAGTFSSSQSDTVTNFAIQPGGGVDVKLSNAVGLRFGGSFRAVNGEGGWGKIAQFYSGLVFSVK